MIEVELKYRVSQEVISALFAKHEEAFTESVLQRDAVYLLGAKSFQEFVPGSPVLRVRTAGIESSLTLKRKVLDTGDMIEIETQVSSAEAAEEIISNLGLTKVTDVEKTRRTASISGVDVCIDDVRGLGFFVELELLANDQQEAESARVVLLGLAEHLGLRDDWVESRKYDELLAEEA